jgi:hypothetical protein
MSNLPSNSQGPTYYVVKAAGDNDGLYEDQPGKDVHYFVANNRSYGSFSEAKKVARELAAKTPENRYYVVRAKYGVMTQAPKIQEEKYR